MKDETKNQSYDFTCMWSCSQRDPFKFGCRLLNLFTTNEQDAIDTCKNCLYFNDTNIETDD
jgi:hypothetical protein